MTTNLRIAPLFTASTTLSANANWPATLKGLLQGQMVNDAGKLVVIEELMYATVEAKWQNNSAVYFPFYHDNIPIFFLTYLKNRVFVSRAERIKKFSNHLEVCIRRITFAPAFEREGRQLT
ncbi:MAG: hypothetical protein ACLRS8_02330 [Parabacteroides merdae]